MNKWILKLCRENFKFVFEMCLGITADEFNMGKLIRGYLLRCHGTVLLFFVSFFILLEEVCELFIVFELRFLHWRNPMNMLPKVLEMVHKDFLLFDELVYI